MYAARSMCTISHQNAPLKKTWEGITPTTRPLRTAIPAGWFIQLLAAMTEAVPPTPARVTTTPVKKCGHGGSLCQP